MAYWGYEQRSVLDRGININTAEIKKYYCEKSVSSTIPGKHRRERNTRIPKAVPYAGSKFTIPAHDIEKEKNLNIVVPTAEMSDAEALNYVLVALSHVIRRQLEFDATCKSTELFQAPIAKLGRNYYPNEVEKETPEYFMNEKLKQEKLENLGKKSTWLRRIHVTSEDKVNYSFDRTMKSKKKKGRHVKQDQVNSWSKLQGQYINDKKQRFEHLLAVLEEQQLLEVKRELRKVESSVGLDKLLYARTLGAIAKERAESSDRIIRILDEYEMISGYEVAQYLKQTAESMRRRLCSRRDKSSQLAQKSVSHSTRKKEKKHRKITLQAPPNCSLSMENANTKNRSFSTVLHAPMHRMSN